MAVSEADVLNNCFASVLHMKIQIICPILRKDK